MILSSILNFTVSYLKSLKHNGWAIIIKEEYELACSMDF